MDRHAGESFLAQNGYFLCVLLETKDGVLNAYRGWKIEFGNFAQFRNKIFLDCRFFFV